MDVWVGAGTHDIGFEKDQRNGKVTHKIDPAVDGERVNGDHCFVVRGFWLRDVGEADHIVYVSSR